MYLRPEYVQGQYTTRLTGPKRRTADSNGWRAALSQGPASKRRRPHAASARARVAVPALASGLLLVHHEDAYQSVRTCPGARGWGEARAAGAVPSSCTEMAPHVVVVCSACQPRPSHGPRPATGWAMSISADKELPHLIQPVAEAWTADRSQVPHLGIVVVF